MLLLLNFNLLPLRKPLLVLEYITVVLTWRVSLLPGTGPPSSVPCWSIGERLRVPGTPGASQGEGRDFELPRNLSKAKKKNLGLLETRTVLVNSVLD